MKKLFEQKGYWNWEHVVFTACIVKPIENKEKPMYWCNVFAGQERQAIEITCNTETWIIDNNVGDGYLKVTIGGGSPSCGHKSYSGYEHVRYLENEEMITSFNIDLEREEDNIINEYQKKNFPTEYAENQELLASLRSFQAMTSSEKIK